MARTEMFQMRVSPEERRHLRVLAERAQRSESDVIRSLLAQLDPKQVGIGFSPPTPPETQVSERELSVA
jgi:hypothetical protein